jgi:hypothetical protein
VSLSDVTVKARDVSAAVKQGAVDVAAASIAAASVAPFVAAVDKAIAETATGKVSVWQSLGNSAREMVTSPLSYLRAPPFRYMCALYGGTYAAANLFSSYEESRSTSMPLGKTSAIFVANSSLALWKDRAFARLFGGAPKPVPAPAYAAWWCRDFVSMGVIFVAPPMVAKVAKEQYGMEQKNAELLAQVSLPLMLQPFVAPLHLYGYVAYNFQDASRQQQMVVMREQIWGAVQMRWMRTVAPFCIGTNVNKNLRKSLGEAVA